MKKITIFAVTILVSLKSYSQITKGNWLVGGNIKFASTRFHSDMGQRNSHYDVGIDPNIGYFILHRLATGLKTNINLTGNKATGTSVYGTNTDYNFGPFVRYYFLSGESPFNILIEGSYQYGFIGGGLNNEKTSKNTFSFATGPVIYFNTSVGLEFLIGYSSYKYSGFPGTNNIIQLGLGFQFYLEKNK